MRLLQTWQTARDSGWSEAQLSEAFDPVAANLFTNYFNHYSGAELDMPPAPPIPDGED